MRPQPVRRHGPSGTSACRWTLRAFAGLALIYAAMVLYAWKMIERRSDAYQAALAAYHLPSVEARSLELPRGVGPREPFPSAPPESMPAQMQPELPNRLETLLHLLSREQTVRKRLGLDGSLQYTLEDARVLESAGLLTADEAELLEQLHQALTKR